MKLQSNKSNLAKSIHDDSSFIFLCPLLSDSEQFNRYMNWECCLLKNYGEMTETNCLLNHKRCNKVFFDCYCEKGWLIPVLNSRRQRVLLSKNIYTYNNKIASKINSRNTRSLNGIFEEKCIAIQLLETNKRQRPTIHNHHHHY